MSKASKHKPGDKIFLLERIYSNGETRCQLYGSKSGLMNGVSSVKGEIKVRSPYSPIRYKVYSIDNPKWKFFQDDPTLKQMIV